MELDDLTEMAACGRKESLTVALADKPACVTCVNKLGNHLIHTAVLNGQTDIVKLIVKSLFGALEVDALNNQKKTPLHLAIVTGNPEMVSLLLDLNASTDIADDSEMMPIHLAAEQESYRVLQILLERGINPNLRGDGGCSALHFAAAADNAKGISVLYGGNLTIRSNTGACPVHIACKSGSSNALEAIIREGPWHNYSVESILSMKDRERQLPIHAAVTGGKVETLMTCLKHGALVTSQQDDGSTPVHYAATQGNVDMLRAMYLMDKKRMNTAVSMRDIQGKTPLHWATFFNHVDVVKYLISLGADVNTSDFNQQTPLLSAASNGSWAALHLLLANGADGSATDSSRHNFLHLAIRRGVDLQVLFDGLKHFDNIKERMNEKDSHGNTPLHLAAKEGYVPAVERMLKLGASPTIKDKNRQSAFHLAASQGRIKTCKLLLSCPNGSIMKNEADGAGMTALHLAAQNGHLKILTILIQRGALIVRDNKDNTPLHRAAASGHTACVHLMLAMHGVLLDCLNIDGNTALHLSASNGHAAVVRMLLTAGAGLIYNASGRGFFDDVIGKGHLAVAEAVVNHERWEQCLQVYSKVYGMPILGLIQHLPSVYMLVLDRCVINSDMDASLPDYCISYNFRYLHLDDDFKYFANEHKMEYAPLMPLELMMNFNRLGCLAHPLTLMFLRMKWNKYGLILSIVDLTIYVMYLASLTWFIVANRSLNHYDPVVLSERPSWDLTNFDDFILPSNFTRIPPPKYIYQKGSWDMHSPWFPPEARGYKIHALDHVLLLVVISFCGFQVVKECYQFYRQKLHYLKVLKNYLEWATFVTSLFFSVPFLLGYSTHVQWDAGALAIFLAWFNCLVNLQRFELVGIYIVMFLAIMKTLVQVFLIFMILVTAFGLAFYVLMQEDPLNAHSTPFLSIYRTFILIFEIEYLLTLNTVYLDNDPSTLHYSTLTFIFLAIFLFCMPLLLVNLLIGLAVGDIASVQSDAKQQKLATQVNFHASVEGMIPFLAKTQNDFKVYPNRYGYSCGEGATYVAGCHLWGTRGFLPGIHVVSWVCLPHGELVKQLMTWTQRVFTKMAGITFVREVTPRVEETLVGKEIVKVKSRLKDLFTICEKNREILQEMMKHMGFVTEDEVKDREAELRLSEGSMEDLALRATQTSKQKSTTKMGRTNIWKS